MEDLSSITVGMLFTHAWLVSLKELEPAFATNNDLAGDKLVSHLATPATLGSYLQGALGHEFRHKCVLNSTHFLNTITRLTIKANRYLPSYFFPSHFFPSRQKTLRVGNEVSLPRTVENRHQKKLYARRMTRNQ